MRKILPCALVVLLACVLVFPASAAGLVDPTIYATGRETVGQSTYMTIDGLNDLTGGATIISGTTSYFSGTSKAITAASAKLYWYPFGANSKADISTFKTGGTVIVHILMDCEDYFYGIGEFGVEFFNSSGTSLGSQWFNSSTAEYGEGVFQFVWNPPSGATTAYFISRSTLTSYSGTSVTDTFALRLFTIKYEMTSDAANNAAIGSIDDAINGSGGEPVSPDGSGAIDDLNKAENDLMQGADSAKDEISSIGDDAVSFFEQFAGVFAFFSFLLGLVLNAFPLWRVLLYVSLSVGIFASIVGIVGNFHYERSSVSSDQYENLKAIYEGRYWLWSHGLGGKK